MILQVIKNQQLGEKFVTILGAARFLQWLSPDMPESQFFLYMA